MRFRVALAASLLAFAAADARAQVAAAPSNLQEPPEASRLYFVDLRDGSLRPLEYQGTKEERRASVYGYLQLDKNAAVFTEGTPLLFVYRSEMSQKQFDAELKRGNVGLFKVEVLVPRPFRDNEDGRGRGYSTGSLLPVHEEAYGPRKTGINPKKPNLAAQTYVLWPAKFLPLGDYALTLFPSGIFGCAGCGFGGYPFRIVAGPAAAVAVPPLATPRQAPPSVAEAGTAKVTIESAPANAEVSVDGEFIGTTPLVGYSLKAGMRRITISKKGFAAWTRELKVSAGVDTRIAAELSLQD